MNSTLVQKTEEALASLGVSARTLAEAQRRSLDDRGYLVVPGVVGDRLLQRLREAFDRTCDAEGIAPRGTRHPKALVDGEPAFLGFLMHPAVLAAARHLLAGPFQVGAAVGRDPMPGFGQQSLHMDGVDAASCQIVTVLGMVDDFTEHNGATRVVPGSHRAQRAPSKSFADPSSRHPDQVTVIAPAGSALVFDGRLWHGGTCNRSTSHRRAVQSAFVGRKLVQQAHDQLEQFGVDPADQPHLGRGPATGDLAPAVRFLLGLDAD